MDVEKILKLIEAVSQSDLTEFDYDGEDGSLILSKKQDQVVVKPSGEYVVTVPAGQNPSTIQTASIQQPATSEAASCQQPITDVMAKEAVHEMDEDVKTEETGREIKSPLVGTFYTAPSPDDAPYVRVGDTVKKGQTLGIVEAMKLMNEIESEYDGVVQKILVENEAVVEYGQPMFIIG